MLSWSTSESRKSSSRVWHEMTKAIPCREEFNNYLSVQIRRQHSVCVCIHICECLKATPFPPPFQAILKNASEASRTHNLKLDTQLYCKCPERCLPACYHAWQNVLVLIIGFCSMHQSLPSTSCLEMVSTVIYIQF
uniref:Uncharacterized protein n=2 Tax=Micrurus TaxID=8634 RepID=A0A2D4KFE2_9SAUR